MGAEAECVWSDANCEMVVVLAFWVVDVAEVTVDAEKCGSTCGSVAYDVTWTAEGDWV